MKLIDRVLILGFVVLLLGGGLMLFTFDVIKIDWLSFMEVQTSYKPMENPLPVPAQSVPVEGAAYVPGMGAPVNPIAADDVSVARGAQLFNFNCSHCHGVGGQGNGPIAAYLEKRKPADLTSAAVQSKSDGALFLTISGSSSRAASAWIRRGRSLPIRRCRRNWRSRTWKRCSRRPG